MIHHADFWASCRAILRIYLNQPSAAWAEILTLCISIEAVSVVAVSGQVPSLIWNLRPLV
jgi:hypothetical protein